SCRGKQRTQALLYFRLDTKDPFEIYLLHKSKFMYTGLDTRSDGKFLIDEQFAKMVQ
ncbi:8456_t:CDS:1, partial [Racocetra persica]